METTGEAQEIEIDLRQLFSLLLHKLWIIILSGILVALSVYLVSTFLLSPKYESTTKIYVMNKQDESAITYSDIQISSQLTNDYKTLVTSRPVVETVIEKLELYMDYNSLVGMISVSNPPNTRILNITITYTDPYMAKVIADAIREESAEHISNVMDIKKVNIVEEANLPSGPSSPNTFINTVVGFMLGILLSSGMIILINLMDDRIKTPDDIERYLGLSVLGAIPIENSINRPLIKDRRISKWRK